MFKKEIYSLLLFSFGLLFTCCGESATDDEEKDNNGQEVLVWRLITCLLQTPT